MYSVLQNAPRPTHLHCGINIPLILVPISYTLWPIHLHWVQLPLPWPTHLQWLQYTPWAHMGWPHLVCEIVPLAGLYQMGQLRGQFHIPDRAIRHGPMGYIVAIADGWAEMWAAKQKSEICQSSLALSLLKLCSVTWIIGIYLQSGWDISKWLWSNGLELWNTWVQVMWLWSRVQFLLDAIVKNAKTQSCSTQIETTKVMSHNILWPHFRWLYLHL